MITLIKLPVQANNFYESPETYYFAVITIEKTKGTICPFGKY